MSMTMQSTLSRIVCLSLTCDTLRAVLSYTQKTAPTSVWLLRLRLPWARQLLTAVSALAAASHTAG